MIKADQYQLIRELYAMQLKAFRKGRLPDGLAFPATQQGSTARARFSRLKNRPGSANLLL